VISEFFHLGRSVVTNWIRRRLDLSNRDQWGALLNLPDEDESSLNPF